MVVAYDGTGYNGWQVQPAGRTVQGHLEEVLSRVLKERVRVVGSGRTDAGVHALFQVVHFDTSSTMPADVMLKAFNANLDSSVVVRWIEEVDSSFHARFSAKSRVYRYFISLVRLPFFHRYSWYFPAQLDIDAMRAASSLFVGDHDFACYGKPMVPGGETKRRVFRCQVRRRRARIEVVVEANAFLRKMVRNMVGALVKVGQGKASVEDIELSLKELKPIRALKPAPPQGLFLWRVNY